MKQILDTLNYIVAYHRPSKQVYLTIFQASSPRCALCLALWHPKSKCSEYPSGIVFEVKGISFLGHANYHKPSSTENMSDSASGKQNVRERIQNAIGSLDEQIHHMDISEDAKQGILDNFNWLLAKSREQPDGQTADFLNDQICGLLDLVDSISSSEEETSSPLVPKEENATERNSQDGKQNASSSESPLFINEQEQRGSPKGRDWMQNGKLTEET